MSEVLDVTNYEEENADLLSELQSQISAPPGHDPIIGHMWQGFLAELPRESGLAEIFNSFQEWRDTGSASERAGLLRTIFMADVLRDEQPYHLAIPQTFEDWRGYFQDLSRDYHEHNHSYDRQIGARIDDLAFNILDASKEVQTNIDSRYVSAELVMQTEPKFRDGVVWLDVGCGIQQGQHALALKDQLPLGSVRTVTEAVADTPGAINDKVTELLARPSLIAAGIGLDVFDPRDRKSKRWVRASLRPSSELLDPDFMARYDTLADAEIPYIESRAVDITDAEAVTQLLDERPDFRPNLVTLYTFPHQLERHEREQAARNVRRIAGPSATLLLQDFAYSTTERPNFLRYYGKWHEPYRYSMFRRELGGDSDYWQKQLSFNESHGNVLKLTSSMVDRVLSA